MKKLLVIGSILLGFSVGAFGAVWYKHTHKDYAYLSLKNASTFAYGGVGYGGAPLGTLYAFKDILARDNASSVFKKLLGRASNEGKLYALAGLYFKDYDFYQQNIMDYANNIKFVRFQSGCTVNTLIPMDSIILGNKDVTVRLENNKQTIQEWVSINNFKTGINGDFIGGSIPTRIKDYIDTLEKFEIF